MKYLILLLMTTSAYAEDWTDCKLNKEGLCIVESEKLVEETVKEKTPAVYKDSKIRRKTKDGKIQEFDGDNFKIVPRTQKRYTKKITKVVVKPINKQKRHHLNLLVGHAPAEHMEKDVYSNGAKVTHKHGLHLGLSYSYDLLKLNEDLDLSVGAQILTNETIMGSIGVSF